MEILDFHKLGFIMFPFASGDERVFNGADFMGKEQKGKTIAMKRRFGKKYFNSVSDVTSYFQLNYEYWAII